VVEWYHRGLGAFERPVHGGEEFEAPFKARLLALALTFADRGAPAKSELEALVAETSAFRAELDEKMKHGRDRLLELASFNPAVARDVIERIRVADADPQVRHALYALLDHFGVRIKDHEEGDVFLDPSHAYLESFPSIPPDGMLATFNRTRAIAREDIRFLSADHPLVQDAIDLLIDSPAGTTAFGAVEAKTPNLLLEAVFVLEAMADTRWHVDRFLAPTPVRVVVDLRGGDLTAQRDVGTLAGYVEDGDLHRFLERPGFGPDAIRTMLETATRRAEADAAQLRETATAEAARTLKAELQRLTDLQKVNDHVRPEEVALLTQQLERTQAAIKDARLRLDSLRLVLEGPQRG
jgi:ATP-dependent helicase HepA